jgi:hypothetical protein
LWYQLKDRGHLSSQAANLHDGLELLLLSDALIWLFGLKALAAKKRSLSPFASHAQDFSFEHSSFANNSDDGSKRNLTNLMQVDHY